MVIPLIALYTDWRPFAFSTGYVAVMHGVLGTVTPETMYNHAAAVESPYLWGLIHAAFILTLCAVMLVHWNFSDRKRLELRAALDDLQQTQRPDHGQGLAIAQSLVGGLGGHIELVSEVGVGTTFTIVLPTRQADDVRRSRADDVDG